MQFCASAFWGKAMTEDRAGIHIPDHIVKQVEQWLVEDEKLILVAQPDPVLAATDWRNLYACFAGLLFGGFLLLTAPAFMRGADLGFQCLLIGLFLAPIFFFLMPIMTYRTAKKTVYALTNKRAFISVNGQYPVSYGRRDITTLTV
jgi:hypothetical protein